MHMPPAMDLKDPESFDRYNDVWHRHVFLPGWAAASQQMVQGALFILFCKWYLS